MSIINHLLQKMTAYYAGDPKRIHHFIKVHSFSKQIGELEQLDKSTQFVLEIASIVHDIGIKVAEEKYGKCHGKLQEEEGPAVAKDMLTVLGVDASIIARVCYLVGHHHTYAHIDGMDYQILIEADFLVNMFEDDFSKSAITATYGNIFKTASGKRICKNMYAIHEQESS
ncbi:HD domain-containing protein [Vallitalea pronyensis]|uniref:HD domain-containing protein n=1 Tax=Vallitalea pronyensis TaxID=1348613 RepID=A0A8J8MM64_9FIRM|nr:HD domain-containing protein [Vallitalea pronyensis]QUI24076.1 HD domain-containing protein [Vallitalea pronyensis]